MSLKFILKRYRICLVFKLNKPRKLLVGHFWPLMKQVVFFKAAGADAKIGSSHYNLAKIVQIPDTHCRTVEFAFL